VSDSQSILVIVPSRLRRRDDGTFLFERAIRSIFNQTAAKGISIDVVVGVDPGSEIPNVPSLPQNVRFTHAQKASQAAALNASAGSLDHTYLAVLEDDDEWHPEFLRVALEALKQLEFVSSTQLMVDTKGEVVCILDFPTPSGWVMERRIWHTVGPFDETYRFHLDNEWLGRLAEAGFKRGHLVEATAPIKAEWLKKMRPELYRVVELGGPAVTFARHPFLTPLVRRLEHEASGISLIYTDPSAREQSETEQARLQKRFGRIPW